jgi:hypothetical protein
VLITLNDNTQIGVLNASFDFSEGVSDPLNEFYVEKFGKNVDDFVRYTEKTCPEVFCEDFDLPDYLDRPIEICDYPVLMS